MYILRTFHPVGHGAFYSEKHDGFNIVYDCGTMSNRTNADNVVSKAFNSNDTIDYLFISHFDSDHISHIVKLKQTVKTIKNIVLPLLHEDHKIFLININRVLRSGLIGFIKDPRKYLKRKIGDETEIILINSNDNIEGNINKTFKLSPYWVFIPYNVDVNNARYNQLLTELDNAKFSVDCLKGDSKYTLSMATLQQREIRYIYKRINGRHNAVIGSSYNINFNSMLLYSGPVQNIESANQFKRCGIIYNNILNQINDAAGCIYTGDSDLNKADINSVFASYMQHVGTIQIPHHGSIGNFNIKQIKNKCACPISCPNNNSNHPNQAVINDINNIGSVPIKVTEDPHSVYYDLIYKI